LSISKVGVNFSFPEPPKGNKTEIIEE